MYFESPLKFKVDGSRFWGEWRIWLRGVTRWWGDALFVSWLYIIRNYRRHLMRCSRTHNFLMEFMNIQSIWITFIKLFIINLVWIRKRLTAKRIGSSNQIYLRITSCTIVKLGKQLAFDCRMVWSLKNMVINI